MERWVWALRFIGVGWYVALCIVLGAFLGLWLDHKLHTTPWLAIAGIVVGTFVDIERATYEDQLDALRPKEGAATR